MAAATAATGVMSAMALAATASMMTTTVATATAATGVVSTVARATATTAAASAEKAGRCVATEHGEANNREENRNTKHNKSVHSGILQ